MSIDRVVLASTVAMAALWAYGLTLGLLGGYPTIHVLRNFFGIGFFFPALLSVSVLLGTAEVWRIAVRSGAWSLAILVALRVASIFDLVPPRAFQVIGIPVGLSDFGVRIYSFGVFPIFGWQAVVGVRLYEAVAQRDHRSAAAGAVKLLAIVAATWFVTESKGMLLGSIAVLGVPLLMMRRWSTHLQYAAIAIVIVILEMQVIIPGTTHVAVNWLGLQRSEIMTSFVERARLSAEEAGDMPLGDNPSNPVDMIFGAHSLGNVERYTQARELWNDVVWSGHGLGAPVRSGYSRSVAYPYGFELSFLNVVHKFGVFSILYFAFLSYCGFRIVTSPVPTVERAAALGLFGYIFVSIGNPVLFLLAAVFLHMLAVHGVTRTTFTTPAAATHDRRRRLARA
jgi:hypothetical protein